jgi:hypothetical protein
MPTIYSSLEQFKAKAKLLKPYTENGKHQEALDLFARILGYKGYCVLAASDITRGEEPILDKMLVLMGRLLPKRTEHLHRKLLDDLGVLLTQDYPGTVLPVISEECLSNYLEKDAGKVSPTLRGKFNRSVDALARALANNGQNKRLEAPSFGNMLESLIYREPGTPVLTSIQQVEETAKSMLRITGALAVASCATGVAAEVVNGSIAGINVARKATTIALAELQECYGYLETLPFAPLETLDFLSQFGGVIATLLFRQKRLIELQELTVRIKQLYAAVPNDAGSDEKSERARAARALTLTLTGIAMKKLSSGRILQLLDAETGWLKNEMLAVDLLRTIALAQLRRTHEALAVARVSALDRSIVKLLLETVRSPETRQLIDVPSATQLQQQYWKRFGFDLATIKLSGFSEAIRMFEHFDELYKVNPSQAHSDSPEMLKNWFSFENQIETSLRPSLYRPVKTAWKFWSHVRTGIRYIP